MRWPVGFMPPLEVRRYGWTVRQGMVRGERLVHLHRACLFKGVVMKLLLSSFALLCSMSMVAQDRDRSPSVPPVATAAQTVVNEPASSVTGATVPPNNRP